MAAETEKFIQGRQCALDGYLEKPVQEAQPK
jgi:hypothetical protein